MFDKYYGQKILSASLDEEGLTLSLGNGKIIMLWDDQPICSERRYMSSDDDIQSLVGSTLTRVEARESPTDYDVWEVHETCFLEVGMNHGFITLVNHNEHNGYYGGFNVAIEEKET